MQLNYLFDAFVQLNSFVNDYFFFVVIEILHNSILLEYKYKIFYKIKLKVDITEFCIIMTNTYNFVGFSKQSILNKVVMFAIVGLFNI